MRLRSHTVAAFVDAALDRARDRIVAALRQTLPGDTSHVTVETLQALCDYGITRAAVYGLDTERSIYVYVAAMVLYGEQFDTNPRLPWAPEILNGEIIDQEVISKGLELQIAIDKGKRI